MSNYRRKGVWKLQRLRKVVLPEGLESIGGGCFWESGLEEITIPKSVKVIERFAFLKCKSLKKMIFEKGSKLEKIELKAFYGCGNLKIVGAPPLLKEIRKKAFRKTHLEGEF